MREPKLTHRVSPHSDLVAVGTGGIVSITWSLLSPEDFDFDVTRRLNYVPDSIIVDQEAISNTLVETEGNTSIDEKANPASTEEISIGSEGKTTPIDEKASPASTEAISLEEQHVEGDVPEIDFVGLNEAFKFALYWSVGLLVVLVVVSLLTSKRRLKSRRVD